MNQKDRFLPVFWTTAHESTMRIYYQSVSINIPVLNLIFTHTTAIVCMGMVMETAGLWAAKGLWQFVAVCAGYYQFETVCDSL